MRHPFFFSLEFRVLAVPFEEGDGGCVRDVEGACGAGNGYVNHHITLLQYFLTDAMALVAYDECSIGRQLCFVYVGGVCRCFDGDDLFILWDEFAKVVFLGKVPFYIVFA